MALKQLGVLLRKELWLQMRLRSHWLSLWLFALLSLLMFAMALGAQIQLLKQAAPGLLWLTVLFTSTLLLYHSASLEIADDAQQGLLLLGASEAGLFLAKALGVAWWLLLLLAALLPIAAALFDWPLSTTMLGQAWPPLLLGVLGLVAPGILCANLVVHSGAGPMLLPLIFYPLILPCLLAAVAASDIVLNQGITTNLVIYNRLLMLFNLIFWGLGVLLFPRLLP